ncbi:Gfo/Idh/MocA family protein [Nitrosopumilus adriaticus]|uniref:Putative Oxidoreductase n=1 Tax=Nitrosopumilus adriaticus TaxID=1580092 RepID=A0A0D5C550_9ARCH|nr:Gfo/Idh/MocA family oxidoreductase [Nitrosopumilus adriaticus]AJW71821.1 putative Oxidoreductase [Nitrosopumilus adriaticus]
MKIVVIGYGSIGKRHVTNLLKISKTEIIICTKQKIKNPSLKRIKIFESISDCLKEKPDIGIIANESSFHIPIAIKLAKAGIDLFVEKPLSNSLKNSKELLSIIEKKKIITQMGCQLRFHKCIKEIKKIISSNKIGKVISVRAECGSFLPDWHPYEDYKKSYAARTELGGGVVLTNIHEIDYLYWIFGDVKEVISVTGSYSDLKISADDLSVGILKFKNNIIAELHLDYFQKPDFRSCKIIGSKGTVFWDSDSNMVTLYDNQKNKWIKVLKWSKYDRNLMYKEELIHFLDCVKKRKITINPVEIDGIKTLKIGLAIIKSSKSRKMIKV